MTSSSLGRAREQSKQIKCLSNLRQIGMAFILYANDNSYALPSRVTTAVPETTNQCSLRWLWRW